MIKILSYVSKINQNQKEIKNLLKQLIKNLNISFNEKETQIKYDEYFFNGIQIPKDIKFDDIGAEDFQIFWKIDNINVKHYDKNNIKFIVELRKENNNEKFHKVYEGNKMNCTIENLILNTNYEIRICSFNNGLIGEWCQIQKIKTNDFDSIILRESKREKEFLDKIYEWSGYKKLELLYRGSRDGSTSQAFHQKCDNQGPTICLYKNEKGYIFGGFASISWTSDGNTHEAKDSFIFTLTNIHGTEPSKFNNKDSNNVNHHKDRGPCFGNYNDIYIQNDFKNTDSYSSFPNNYSDSLGKGKSIFTGDLNNDKNNFRLKEIEIYKLFK